MPCYNAEKTLAKAIESVINQNYVNWELIIIDDASTDNSTRIAKTYLKSNRITLLQNKTNKGCYYSRNRGLYHVKDKEWDWFTIHDSDDTSHPDRFSIYMAVTYNTNIQYMYSAGSGTRWGVSENKLVFKKLKRGIGTAFIHNDIFIKALGYFNSTTRFGGDSEYQFKYLQILSTVINNEIGLDDVLSIVNYCINNKKFIGELSTEYCYLYNFGYTAGKNLTQIVPFSKRQQYKDNYMKKWGKGGLYIKDFYQDFIPNKEDL